ncbi:SAFB-like transcription modulator [Bactrocera tryoni]|uniref:SAFB-like transcription modulator n=1 Tax=Bactrocera tryoni TaxID=59916 RepID=UPI001A9625B4|nr:SAFB-like transcription modulator [Bactrocera tryoni]
MNFPNPASLSEVELAALVKDLREYLLRVEHILNNHNSSITTNSNPNDNSNNNENTNDATISPSPENAQMSIDPPDDTVFIEVRRRKKPKRENPKREEPKREIPKRRRTTSPPETVVIDDFLSSSSSDESEDLTPPKEKNPPPIRILKKESWEKVKSFEDETEVADHILQDDAKTQKEDFTTSLKYIKEKCTDAEGANTGRNSAQKSTKTVAALKDTRTSKGGSSSSKDERQCSKRDDDKSKRKDEKSGDKKDKDISEQKSSSNKTSQKDDKVNTSTKLSSTGKLTKPSRNLLVSGLSSLTRASDLKTIFSKYGKVIGAKVVINSRTPGTSCYGYATMSSSSDASRSVAKRRVDTTKKDEDKKIRDTTSKTRDDKQTIDTKKDDVSKKPEVEKDKQRDKEKEKDHNKKDVNKTIEIAIIDPVGKADVVTTIWELLIPWQR